MKNCMATALVAWLLMLTGTSLCADSVTNTPGRAPHRAWIRAYQLTAITSTNGIARAVFLWRPGRLAFGVGVGERLTNSTIRVRAIDARRGTVMLADEDVLVEFHLREYQRAAQPPSDKIVLNFEDTDLRTVLLYLGELTGATILPAACVRGQVTLINPQPVTRAQAVELITALIESCNFTLIRGPHVIKVVPMAHAAPAPTNDLARAELQVLPLRHAKADVVTAQLNQMLSAPSMRSANTLTIGSQTVNLAPPPINCSFMAIAAANCVAVIGDVRVMALVQKAVALLDVPAWSPCDDATCTIVLLKHVAPQEVAALLQCMCSWPLVARALPGTRLLLYRTDGKYVDKVRRIIERCDSAADVTWRTRCTVPLGAAGAGALLGGATMALVRRRR